MKRSLQSAIVTTTSVAAVAATTTNLLREPPSLGSWDSDTNSASSSSSATDGGASVSNNNKVFSERTAARKLYNSCSRCHVGLPWAPQFWSEQDCLFGQKAGTLYPDYPYSNALKDSNVVWNETTLDLWLTNPGDFIPGTAMSYAGLSDPVARQEIIDTLKSFCEDVGNETDDDPTTQAPTEADDSSAMTPSSVMWLGPTLWIGTILLWGGRR